MEENKLHIVMMPWLAMGHLIPFMELSKRIAQQGHKIFFISTPKNFSRLPKLPQNLSHLINLVPFDLPPIKELPNDAEASVDLSSDEVRPYLRKAYDSLQFKVSDFIQVAKPDWIIIDYAPYWIPEIATKYGIPCAFLNLFNGASMTFYGSLSVLRGATGPRTTPEDFTKVPEWVPFDSSIYYRYYEACELFALGRIPEVSGVPEAIRLANAIEDCKVVAIRSSKDFEKERLTLLESLYGKPVIPVGFFSPLPIIDLSISWTCVIEWLDRHEQGEVIYVSFGSEANLTRSQIHEIALGLEMSQLPFIWALRDTNGLPQDFEERIKSKGLICKEWVPQVNILSHSSVGGFLSHGGWNSIIEGLSLGIKLILLPFLGDQGLNARDLVERGICVEVERNEKDGSFTGQDISKSLTLVMKEKEGEQFGHKVEEYKMIFGDEEMNENSLRYFLKYLLDN